MTRRWRTVMRRERSYEALIDGASRVTQDHEVLIAVQVDQRRAWSRAARDPHVRQLDRDEQACRVLARELQALASRFDPVDLAVAGLLTPEQYAAALHVAFDPYRGAAQSIGCSCRSRHVRADGSRHELDDLAHRWRVPSHLLDRAVAAAAGRARSS